jgi:hypothetical protein
MIPMGEEVKLAFDFARSLSQQLITLSTAIIAVTVTFARDLKIGSSGAAKHLIRVSWTLYLISILCGVWSLMALTGNLAPAQGTAVLNLQGLNIRIPAGLQVISFLLATIMLILQAVWRQPASDSLIERHKMERLDEPPPG